jgi:SAM-dependent MidA family methyltransferase
MVRRLPSSILHLPSSLLEVLPDNYTIETSPAAEDWWRGAAGILQRGKLLAIDYGFTADEMFSPGRTRGTLRAYHRHRVSDDLLAHPGEQDLTAHVNFTAIQQVGEEAGLATETFCTQPQFLTRILQKAAADESFAGLDAKQVRQFQTLTHPEHLGHAFRVLVQSRVG